MSLSDIAPRHTDQGPAPRVVARALGWIGCVALHACSANEDIPAPAISTLQPDRGTPGSIVTVSGANLCQQPRDGSDVDPLACAHVGTVVFGTTPGIATVYADTTVMAEVPALPAGEFGVMVSVAGRSSNSLGFVVE
ncbi:MAG TPA: IPT/TIG domain-containing protein [Kofleriaceae bacterium]|nr:IPT/TIG domain-containing protein [Kofleriaceae bacterium]